MNTYLWIIAALLATIAYPNIGYLLAHWSWKKFAELIDEKPSSKTFSWWTNTAYSYYLSTSHWILFPITCLRIKMSQHGSVTMAVRSSDDLGDLTNPKINSCSQKEYKRRMLLFWPFKAIWNLPWIIVFSVIFALKFLSRQSKKLPSLLTYPSRRIFKINHI